MNYPKGVDHFFPSDFTNDLFCSDLFTNTIQNNHQQSSNIYANSCLHNHNDLNGPNNNNNSRLNNTNNFTGDLNESTAEGKQGESQFEHHYPHFIPVMEIFAIALQERQKTWKLREQFSKVRVPQG